MFSITEHIEFLMTRHDCVAIPGWGAFIANYSPARYDEDRATMQRPRRTIGFNASASHNDGLLAQSLMRREGMTYDEAMRFIADSVTAYRRQLAMDCEVSMGRLGYFRRVEGRYTEFVPSLRADSLDQYYGLGDLPIKTVAALEQEQAARLEPRAAIVPQGRNLFVRKAAQIAASVAVLIGLTVMLSTPITVDRGNQQLASMAPTVTAPQPQRLDVTVEQGVSAQPVSVQPVSAVEQPQQPTIASVGNESGHYYMVIATVRNQQELEKFKKKYPQLVPSMKLLDYKGMKCVYVARSDDSSVLMGLRDELPESLRDIWIYS